MTSFSKTLSSVVPVEMNKEMEGDHWFVIEGNIGSGKSTLCRKLNEDMSDAEVIFEPVDKWRNTIDEKTGNNILQNFYVDQERWSYSFQTYTFLTRMEDVMKKQEKPIRFIERSIYTDKLVFARTLFDTEKMTSLEWNMYNRWFDWLSEECFTRTKRPSGFIYIRADPKTSYDRMLKRERSEEKCVPLDYLTTVSEYHDQWLMQEGQEDVLVINVDKDFESTPEEWERVNGLIQEFVAKKTGKFPLQDN